MAQPKKNTLHQILVPMVDSTDFASIESAITASDFNSGVTAKFYGWNTGGSAATTSGAISKLASLVRSGVFRVTLKASENNYDYVMARFNKTGCAEQILQWSNVDNDDSDLMSALTVIQSMASDAASAAQQANSRVLLNQSRISDIASFLVVMSGIQSDIYSALSDFQSDFGSRVPKRVATDSQLSNLISGVQSADLSDIASAVLLELGSYLSDILSAATQTNSRALVAQSYLSDIRSHVSDLQSDFGSRVPKLVATNSQLSDMASDLKSAIAGVTATIGASDMSDIASQVWVHATGAAVASRVLLAKSSLSDIASFLSDFGSDFQSRVPKRVATDSQLSDLASDLKSAVGGITVTLSASDISDIASAVAATAGALTASEISDIASAVWANVAGAAVASRVLVAQSYLSDIRSHVSDLQSDFQSRVPKRVATDSQLSDLASNVKSAVTALASMASDAASAAQQANSRLSDLQSDFQSRVPKRVATDSQLSDLASDVKSAVGVANSRLIVNQSSISDIQSLLTVVESMASDAASAAQQGNSRALVLESSLSDVQSALAVIPVAKLAAHAAAVLVAIIGVGSTTTSVVLNSTTGVEGGAPSSVDDFYNSRVIIFTSGALAGQATEITDYVGATKTLTVVALTAGPIAAVTGVIV